MPRPSSSRAAPRTTPRGNRWRATMGAASTRTRFVGSSAPGAKKRSASWRPRQTRTQRRRSSGTRKRSGATAPPRPSSVRGSSAERGEGGARPRLLRAASQAVGRRRARGRAVSVVRRQRSAGRSTPSAWESVPRKPASTRIGRRGSKRRRPAVSPVSRSSLNNPPRHWALPTSWSVRSPG
jgi:hypothetical protein